ncbi:MULTISPECIES: hypothetical protein [Auritidibacter]|uniref:Uncharacterized protein n=1 Tax=Auritidibacter ignavus TaxID=678932 RepID=A0AAJ6DBV6_9MICC|nr:MULTISPECIES: hypothetical protein [Auritidibacter]WGH85152.1 hypothetical protein QDX20_08625 [Auritidibacter ignavus]WGH92491.1 hypothetical protein QDX21_09220 [Auritidibacter ignavus]WHS29460.1 hypothetical protein QM395_05290 [Auritidibacter ignavus]
MAAAIDALQPVLAIMENVRDLLSAPLIRPTPAGTTPDARNQTMQPTSLHPPFPTWNPTRGRWETSQHDLLARTEPHSGIWPTSGEVRVESAYRRHWPAHPTNGSISSSPPIDKTLLRTLLASDFSPKGATPDQVRTRRGIIALSHQVINLAVHGPAGSPTSWNDRRPCSL